MNMTGSVYLVAGDFERSLDFYKKLLQRDPESANERFAVFCLPGLRLCLMNAWFDALYPERVEAWGEECPLFDDLPAIAEAENARKVFLNLGVEDLAAEYDRILELGIAENLTEIRYLEVLAPYWYFTFIDPDGNPIEITGGMEDET